MRFISLHTVLIVNVFVLTNCILRTSLPEDGRLNFTELSAKYGHFAEQHQVVTDDGYILTIFHIRGRRRTPVLLLHGVADTADCFIIRGKKSLAISLANAGYDVWAGNVRGNKYCRRHRKLNPDTDRKFWDFTFHDTGIYDVPAMIDYILKTTGEKQLQTIGHSQGTTIQFVLLSKRPEYNDKIKLFVGMAPVAFLVDLIEPMKTITSLAPMFRKVIEATGVEETFPDNSVITNLLKLLCSQDFSYEICFLWSSFYITGFDAKRFEREFSKVVVGHYPNHTSRKNLEHSTQLIASKRFCEFDYGPVENLKRYGYIVPPDYNLRKVTTKVALLLGENDPLSRIKDVAILRTLLPNVVKYHVMEDKIWNHVDFTWGNDMPVTLYPILFQLLDKYN